MFRRVSCTLAVMLLFASPAAAQDATMNGVVMDESKAVLPGANVVATSRATGRVFDAVTNERGEYRLVGMPPGRYDTRVELAGFAIVVLSDVELLVGQNATIPYTLKLATLDETVTVTGESPLIDLRTARVAGNIDRRQMEQLPIAGRNWMQLSMMVPGITANAVTDTPGISGLTNFQLNLDGQEITQSTSVTTFGQPGISREAIGEYQVVTNMFDVTNGRSAGIQVQAITRSGTNDFAGSVYGYFRDDKFNAADAYLNRVLPYSNSQMGATFGGPIVKNQMHFFGSYEREREPNTAVISPPALAPQLITMPIEEKKDYYLGRYDAQFGGQDHLAVRGNVYKRFLPERRRHRPPEPRHQEGHHLVLGHGHLVARQLREPAAGTPWRHLQVLLDLRGCRRPDPEPRVPVSWPDPRPQLELSRVHPRNPLSIPLRPDVERRRATT